MKKTIYLILFIAALFVTVAACGASSPDKETGGDDVNAASSVRQTASGNTERQEEAVSAEEGNSSVREESDSAEEGIGTAVNDSILTNGGEEVPLSSLSYYDADSSPVVYYIPDITAEALISAYEALGWEPEGRVGVKISTGESERSNYLRPELIGDFIRLLDGTIVECNTAYGGSRASAAKHRQQAKDNGLLDVAELDILDEEGSMEIAVQGGKRISADYVGEHFRNYDSYVVLSHFKGHTMAGFGGAIKNTSIGFGSSEGKVWIHSGGTRRSGGIWGDQDPFLESMADAAKGVDDYMGDRIIYINVMNRLSVDCDCDGSPAEPDMHDIGILASTDPLALDQACVDLVYAVSDSKSLIERIESRNGLYTLQCGEEIGLGSRHYRLVSLDG